MHKTIFCNALNKITKEIVFIAKSLHFQMISQGGVLHSSLHRCVEIEMALLIPVEKLIILGTKASGRASCNVNLCNVAGLSRLMLLRLLENTDGHNVLHSHNTCQF